MGGLYNIVFGYNEHTAEILDALGVQPNYFGRFRDAFVAEGQIVVYTRNGGVNRQHGETIFTANKFDVKGAEAPGCGCPGCIMKFRIPQHPLYISDRDDSFDSTYASIFFRIPPTHERLKQFDIGKWEPSERWRAAIKRIEGGDLNERELEAGRRLADKLKDVM
jgi:hypothetical protein